MKRFYQTICAFLAFLLAANFSFAQVDSTIVSENDSTTSVDVTLENIFNQKIPKEYVIGSVNVSGNKFFDNALLLSIANLNVGDKFMIPGGDNFSKAIQNLWNQNYFSNAVIYITKLEKPNILHLEVEVTERPRLGKFEFKGVPKGHAEDLNSKAALVAGRVVTENMKRNAVEAIEKFYTEKGFSKIKVSIQEIINPKVQNSIDLIFDIVRGEKVKIDNIFFSNNQNVTDAKLKKQLKGTKEKGRFDLKGNTDSSIFENTTRLKFKHILKEGTWLRPSKIKVFLDPYVRLKPLASAKFNLKKFEEDKEAVLEYYNSQGYRDARIVKDTFFYDKDNELQVELNISEGRKYYFGNIIFRGNTKYPDSILNTILSIKKGDVYNIETLNKRLGKQVTPEGGDISGLYMDDGYLFFQANAIETGVYNDTIDHEIRLQEGPQATIKNVRISGNDKTKEYVIRRELRTLPGEKFSRADLMRSQREIAALNYFNQEKIGINPIPNQDDGTVDINYSVEERSSDQLELSAGWGGGIGLTGTLGITFNNFSIRNIFKKSSWDPLPSGDGQKLSIRMQSNGSAFRSYNFSFTEPWLGGKKRNAFTIGAFDTKYGNSYDPNTGQFVKKPSSYIRTTGASISLGKQLKWPDDFFSLSTAISYTRYTLKNYAFFQGFDSGASNNLNLKFALQRSSIDQPMFPRSGSNFLLSVALTPPWSLFTPNKVYNTPQQKYGLVEYHKWRFNGEWFVPLGRARGEEHNKQFVLRLAAKYGFIGNYNKKVEVSPFERFQVGDAGMNNNGVSFLGFDVIAHRGYPVYESSNPKVNPDQQGASNYFTIFNKYVAEIRYPLSLNPSSTIYALGFFEAANGWYKLKEYNPFKLRRSVGIGMRFFLPMFGLLGFDYGIGLDRITPGGGLKGAGKFTFMLGQEPE